MLLMIGVGGVFVSIGIALTVIGVTTQEKKAVSRSLAALDAMSGNGPDLSKELDLPFKERVIEPAIAKFSRMGRRLAPSDGTSRIQHRLDVAGNPIGWTADRIVGLKTAGFAGMLLLSVVLTTIAGTSLMFTLVAVIGLSLIGYMAPNLYLYQLGSDRSETMQRDLPDALDLLTISVEAGLAFDAALARVAKSTDGPLAQEFARVLQEMNIGMGRTTAMRALGERTSISELKSFVTAMVQADAFGIPIGQVLRIQATEMRTKRRQRAEEKAQKVPVKILFPMLLCIFPALFIVIIGPGAIRIMDTFGKMGG